MNTYVIDSSVAIKWMFNEIHDNEAKKYLFNPLNRIAPDIIYLEFTSAVQKKVKLGTLQKDIGMEIIRTMRASDSIKMYLFQDLLEHSYSLASELSHAVYDCLYLALAIEKSARLVTADLKFYTRVQSSPYANIISWVADPPILT